MPPRTLYSCYVLVLLMTLSMFCSACKDEYSFEGSRQVDTTATFPIDSTTRAEFTIPGTADSCASTIVSGNYRSGDTLTSANTITLHVTVTVRGQYNITTDTVDGIYFMARGRFDRTGDQTVTLSGKGIPSGTGIYSFTATGLSCTVSVMVANAPPPANYLFIADPNNRCVNQIIHGTYTSSVPLTTSNQVTVVVDVKDVGAFAIRTSEINGMMFSYRGYFTATGYQYVVLNGTGTPQQAGITAFIPRIIGAPLTTGTGCTFYVTVH